jgi:plasmid maintenance system killer protein
MMLADTLPLDSRTVLERLRAGRARIADPADWCQRQLTDGRRYCAIGALYADVPCLTAADATPAENHLREPVRVAFSQAADELFGLWPMHVNDDLGHAAVLQVYDRAITVEEARLAEFHGVETGEALSPR